MMGGFVGSWAALFPIEICILGVRGGGSRGVLGRLGGSRGILGEPGVSREAFWTVLGPSWGRLGPSWGRLGRALGHLGAVLGASWAVLGASWAVLGASWAVLGASWGALGGVRGLLERVLSRIHAHPSGYKKLTKTLGKSMIPCAARTVVRGCQARSSSPPTLFCCYDQLSEELSILRSRSTALKTNSHAQSREN